MPAYIGLYAEELLACESSGDWLRTFELLTEVRVLKVDGVPVDTLEAGVRTLARGEWHGRVPSREAASGGTMRGYY